MTNEAVLILETEVPIPMTCAEGTGIAKGAVLKLSDPNTVALADGDEDVFGGIAAEEKIADDGKTKIAVYRGGVFKMKGEGNITAGDTLSTSGSTGGANAVQTSTATSLASKSMAIAFETVTDGQTLLVEIRPGCGVKALA